MMNFLDGLDGWVVMIDEIHRWDGWIGWIDRMVEWI